MHLVFITSDYGVANNPELEADLEHKIREALASGQAVECICLPVGRRPVVIEVAALPVVVKAEKHEPGLKEQPMPHVPVHPAPVPAHKAPHARKKGD